MVAKITVVGNVGGDPEVKQTNEGSPVIVCRVASNYRRRDQGTREWVDLTNWYRVTAFGRLADRLNQQVAQERLTKGTRVIVFGRLEAGAYIDRNNHPQPSLEIVADDMLLVDSRQGDTESPARTREGSRGSEPPARGRMQQVADVEYDDTAF